VEPSAQERCGPVGMGPEEAPAIIREKELLSCEERLRELWLFSLGLFPWLQGNSLAAGEGLFRRA